MGRRSGGQQGLAPVRVARGISCRPTRCQFAPCCPIDRPKPEDRPEGFARRTSRRATIGFVLATRDADGRARAAASPGRSACRRISSSRARTFSPRGCPARIRARTSHVPFCFPFRIRRMHGDAALPAAAAAAAAAVFCGTAARPVRRRVGPERGGSGLQLPGRLHRRLQRPLQRPDGRRLQPDQRRRRRRPESGALVDGIRRVRPSSSPSRATPAGTPATDSVFDPSRPEDWWHEWLGTSPAAAWTFGNGAVLRHRRRRRPLRLGLRLGRRRRSPNPRRRAACSWRAAAGC